MTRTKKTKRTTTGIKNRQSSENPTNNPHAPQLSPRKLHRPAPLGIHVSEVQ
jgi:hypothetical protein